MARAILGLTVGLVFAAGSALAAGDDKNTYLKQALALEKTVQNVIRSAEPSVTSIIVSRRELYGRFGQGPAIDSPGKLGGFSREALQAHALFKQLSATDQKALLARLDLNDETNIPESFGSGIVIDAQGLVLTPY